MHSPRLTNRNGVETRMAPPNTASGGLIQRRHDLPDATVDVFTGILFILVLASEMFVGRLTFLKSKEDKA